MWEGEVIKREGEGEVIMWEGETDHVQTLHC